MSYLKTVEVQYFDTDKLKLGMKIKLRIKHCDEIIDCVIHSVTGTELILYSLEVKKFFSINNVPVYTYSITPQELIDNDYTLISNCNHRDENGEWFIEGLYKEGER